jgi:3-methyladenine DNA glycosylase AlkD
VLDHRGLLQHADDDARVRQQRVRQPGDVSLIARARALLVAAADPSRAPQMQRYMRSTMPYHGVVGAEVKKVAKALFADRPIANEGDYVEMVLELWRGATHREERYLAVILTDHRRGGRAFRSMSTLPIYEEMIVTGAWWDYVDHLASHAIGDLVLAHRPAMTRTMRAWSRDADLWKRRTSIIHQLRFREKTDLALLEHCIEGSIDDTDFFARKAIGWSLRQYAKTDPKWVRAFVGRNETRLSGLSKREALKHQG